jgi:hypothetical protein
MKIRLEYARDVQLFGERGFIRRIPSHIAARLKREHLADRICTGRVIRAMKLTPPIIQDIRTKFGIKLSQTGRTHEEHLGGRTQRPTISHQMRVLDEAKRLYAPAAYRDLYLSVLTECLRDAR